jgi:hypothetical protein
MALSARWEDLRERMNRLNREANSLGGPEWALTTITLAPPVDIRIQDGLSLPSFELALAMDGEEE